MSFKVDWNLLETESMSQWTKELLTDALNSGKRPNILASNIEIKDLNFGHTPPVFEILEIGELEQDRFRGIFKISYDGDSHMTLHTKVQANPLKIYHDNLVELEHYVGGSSNFITPNFLVSNNEFSIPLDLKLSDIKINAIGIIVFSKTKGLTLVFRNDPLDSIKVSSTFDMVQVLANFLQKQIESQIRELFRETLPTVLHKLSLKYISLNNDFDANFLNKLHNIDKEINHDNHSNGENDVILFDLNNESNNYSVKNLQRNLKLFNSRETLNLNIPKFKKIIQRCNLDKYNKNLSPNLLTSLNLLNNDYKLDDYSNSNGIPINLLISKDDNNVQEMIKNISNIQSNNYYKNNVTNNDNKSSINVKPKRRTIKLSKKSDKEQNPSEKSSPLLISKSSSMNTLLKKKAGSEHLDTVDSEDNTLVDSDEIIYPRPIRPKSRINSTSVSTAGSMDHSLANSIDSMAPEPNGQYQEKDPHSHLYRKFNNSPLNSSITGVGIGNNYFNFTSKDPITELEESNKEFNEKINKLYQSRINEINEKYKIKIISHDHDAKLAGKPKSITKVTAKPVAKPVTKSAMKSDVTNHNLSPPKANNKSDNFKLTNDTYLDFKTIKNRLNELRKIEDKSYFDMPPPYQV